MKLEDVDKSDIERDVQHHEAIDCIKDRWKKDRLWNLFREDKIGEMTISQF